jgi:hypothetical protein
MRRNSGSNLKNIFIVIIVFFSIAIIIAAISAITNKKSSIAIENSNIEEKQVLSDSETVKLFSRYRKLYDDSIVLIDSGISGKISKKIFNNTKELSTEIRDLNLKESYKDEQNNLAITFDYLNKSMKAYNDYVYFQSKRVDKFDTSYRYCLDEYNTYLKKSESYYDLID